jgi:hypothetical protein
MFNIAHSMELIFPDQSVEDVWASIEQEAKTSKDVIYRHFNSVASLLRLDDKHSATQLLLKITSDPKNETRILLWAWTILRSLGVYPKAHLANQIQGVVLQTIVNRNIRILAAYADQTVRYTDNEGELIIWKKRNKIVSDLIQQLFEYSKSLLTTHFAIANGLDNVARITILTFKGNYSQVVTPSTTETSIDQILITAIKLMDYLEISLCAPSF